MDPINFKLSLNGKEIGILHLIPHPMGIGVTVTGEVEVEPMGDLPKNAKILGIPEAEPEVQDNADDIGDNLYRRLTGGGDLNGN